MDGKFADNQLWKDGSEESYYATPESACEYIKQKTNSQYICNKNVFGNIELSDIYDILPKKSRKNTKYTMDDMKLIIKVFDKYLEVYI